jgi:hypothetical protein
MTCQPVLFLIENHLLGLSMIHGRRCTAAEGLFITEMEPHRRLTGRVIESLAIGHYKGHTHPPSSSSGAAHKVDRRNDDTINVCGSLTLCHRPADDVNQNKNSADLHTI